MMDVAILTSRRRDVASVCLPLLASDSDINLKAVIFVKNNNRRDSKYIKRRIKKIVKIGPLGVINGIRIRSWFDSLEHDVSDIEMLAEEHSIPFFETPLTNSSRTKKIFHSLDLDLGLSLGNGYISRGVFSIPKFGMINLHTERLPEYRGGHSVLCPILEGETTSGFTIHQIDSGIDTGEIIYKKIVPIEFSPNLKKTVKNT